MNTSEIPGRSRSSRVRLRRRATPVLLAVAFLLVHVAAPWRLSRLSARHGWRDGPSGSSRHPWRDRPGRWNGLALVLVVAGMAGTFRTIAQHYRASRDTFLEMKQGRKLLTPGPYAVSRNPMYLFELAFWLGWALFYGSIPVLAGALLFFVMLNFVIVPYEERDLERRFGEEYRQYKRTVPRWLGKPRFWPRGKRL